MKEIKSDKKTIKAPVQKVIKKSDQENSKKIQALKTKKAISIIASAQAQEIEPTETKAVTIEKENLPTEPLIKKKKIEKITRKPVTKKNKPSLQASSLTKPQTKKQTATFTPPKPKINKKEAVVYDRYLDFSIPERIIQKVFDPKHREITGTVTGQILRQVNHKVNNSDLSLFDYSQSL